MFKQLIIDLAEMWYSSHGFRCCQSRLKPFWHPHLDIDQIGRVEINKKYVTLRFYDTHTLVYICKSTLTEQNILDPDFDPDKLFGPSLKHIWKYYKRKKMKWENR